MEPFKNLIDAALVQSAARHLKRAWPAFDAKRFVAATEGLEALEMKARAMLVAGALEATLPEDFDHAAATIEAALAPPFEHERVSAMTSGPAGLAGWVGWPLGEFVARRGLEQPERALKTLHALTQRFSAEWAVRPFIVRHPDLTFRTLQAWTRDPNVHVRRLVSEGSRPRLPWGLQLKALIADPSPTLPLLEALQDDPSEYVRRSVANHLNDIAKDHPDLVVDWVKRHLPGAPPERVALLRHACRTLVKQGHAGTLRVWGLGAPFVGEARLAVAPKSIRLGNSLTLTLDLTSRARRSQPLVVDYLVHHVKADGGTSPKVFKGWKVELPAGGSVQLVKTHPVRPITTRRYHAGRHEVEVQINGRVAASAAFTLKL